MIIVYNTPYLLFKGADYVILGKVINESGNTLEFKEVYADTGEEITSQTISITSNEQYFNITVQNPEPTSERPILLILQTKDSTGSIASKLVYNSQYAGDYITYNIPSTVEDYEIYYVSKIGLSWKVKNLTVYIPSSKMFYTIIYLRFSSYGRIMIFEGDSKIVDISSKSAIFSMQFKINRSLARNYIYHIKDPDILQIIAKKPELGELLSGLAIVSDMFEIKRFNIIGYSYDYDDNYLYINTDIQVDLMTPIDLWSILKIALSIGAIVGGTILLLASGGASAPVSYVLIASGISTLGLSTITLNDTLRNEGENIVNVANEITTKRINELTETKNKLIDYINQLYSNGEITTNERDKLIQFVNDLFSKGVSAIKELNDLVKNAYEQGREDAKKEMSWWILGSGVAGFAIGIIVSR